MSSNEPFLLSTKKIIVITAPSGAGKSTIVKKLVAHKKELKFSVSCTTRLKREGEMEGKNYYFLSLEDFKRKIQNQDFVEYEEVYKDQFYGTLKTEIDQIWNSRKVALFDIDVKGATAIKKQYGKDALVIYIAPPDKHTLIQRLTNRNTENKDSLKKRIKRAEEELSFQNSFDKIVTNEDFDIAFMNVKNLITKFLNSTH